MMKGVSLVSGGIDSTLMVKLIAEKNIEQLPLFVNYGQLAVKKEWDSCQKVFKNNGLPSPIYFDVSNFGTLIRSGITDSSLDIEADAFLPGRNQLRLPNNT